MEHAWKEAIGMEWARLFAVLALGRMFALIHCLAKRQALDEV